MFLSLARFSHHVITSRHRSAAATAAGRFHVLDRQKHKLFDMVSRSDRYVHCLLYLLQSVQTKPMSTRSTTQAETCSGNPVLYSGNCQSHHNTTHATRPISRYSRDDDNGRLTQLVQFNARDSNIPVPPDSPPQQELCNSATFLQTLYLLSSPFAKFFQVFHYQQPPQPFIIISYLYKYIHIIHRTMLLIHSQGRANLVSLGMHSICTEMQSSHFINNLRLQIYSSRLAK